MARSTSPYDLRYSTREIARMQGLDPGTGPSLEDFTTDKVTEMPTLEALSMRAGEHPKIGDVGVADAGRVLSDDAPGGRAPAYARTWHAREARFFGRER